MSQVDELKSYKQLLDEGVITQAEFNEKKKSLMAKNENASSTASNDDKSTIYMIVGGISAFVSLFFIPILFAAVGIICGYLLTQYDKAHKNIGVILMIASGACGLLGFLLGMAAY
ncbi:SHOCT domain-containing protein [Weissella viridescens]|uniref:SHOCT domain-containing protein n=1 Tax=Weissella viridescens TaxID=1629 RepID=UPI0040565C03